MEESEDNLSAEDLNTTKSPTVKSKPKKRSLVERELETSLTARVISPISADGCSKSRYGRARRLKNENSEPDKSVKTKSPKMEISPKSTVQSPVYKMHASNSPIKLDSQKPEPFESQIENIHSENVALSRFGLAEKKKSPSKRYPKVYIRKDLIQLKDKDKESEETVVLIKNMFSPVKSTQKSNRSSLERSVEKHGKRKLSSKETQSVVKTLDFDSKDNKKEDDKNKKDTGKMDLSKSEIFEIEAKSEYQVGDLAWARMGTYPFWPCIITREPGTELFVKTKLFGRTVRNIFNVTFFGDNGRRSWITDSMLRPFLGQLEFETTRAHFTPEAKKKDPKLYAAFFISERKMPQWLLSVEEAETLLREPKRLRIDLLNSMLMKVWPEKVTPKSDKGKRVTRTDSDVSLSESLYDTLFSEDDTKGNDSDRKNKRKQSLDVSDVVTACLDNMAAKTGITKIQKQSHMDRWLLKAKTKTPEKSQLKSQAVDKPDKTSAKTNKPTPSTSQKPHRFRRSNNESQSSDSRILNDPEASTSSNYKPVSVSNDNAMENSYDELNYESNQTYVSDITNETNNSHKNLSDNDIFKSPLSEADKRVSSERKNVLNKIKQSIDSDENMPSTSSVDISGLSTSFEISRVDSQSTNKDTVESDGNENLSGITDDKICDDIDKTRPFTSSPKNDVRDIEISTENLNAVHEKEQNKSVKEITMGVETKSIECSSKGTDVKDIDCTKKLTDDSDSDLNIDKTQGNKCTTTNIHKSKESEIENKDGSSVNTNFDVQLDTNINNFNSVPENVPQNFRKVKKIKTRQKSIDTCEINETKGSYCNNEKSNVCELNMPNTRSKKLRKSDVFIDVKLGKSTESVNNKIHEEFASKTADKLNENEYNELKQRIDSINHVKSLNKSTTNIENDVHRTTGEQKIEEKHKDLPLDDKQHEISYEETISSKKSKYNQVINGNESLLISETKLKENDFASSLSELVPLSESKCIEQLSINNSPVNDNPKNDLKTEYNNPEFKKYLELKQDNVMDEHPELSQDEITSYLYKTWQYESRDIINNKLTGKDNKAPTKGTNYKALDKERGRIKLGRKKPNDFTQNKTILSPTNKSPVNGYHKEIKPIIISPKNKIIILPKKSTQSTESVKNNISYSDFKISSPIIAKLQTPGIENKVSISSVGNKTTKEVSTDPKNVTSEFPSVPKVENGNLMLLNDKAQMTQNPKSNSNNIKTPEKENKLSSTENTTMPINSCDTDEKLITVPQSKKIPINSLRTTTVDTNKNLSTTENKVNAPQNGPENIISTKPERNEPTTINTDDKSHTLTHNHNGPKVTTISASNSNTKNKEISQNVNTFHNISPNNFKLLPTTGNLEDKKPHISSTNKKTNFVDKETLSSEKCKLKETKVLNNSSLTKTEQRKLKILLTRANISDNFAAASNTPRKTEKPDSETQNKTLQNGNGFFNDVEDAITSNKISSGKIGNHINDVTCPVETLGEENKKPLFTSIHTNNKELNHVNEKLERNENSVIEKVSVTNGNEFADSSTDYDKKCSTNGVEINKDSINSISSDKDNAVGSTAYENKKCSKITIENNHIQTEDSVMGDKESTEYNNKCYKLGVVDNIETKICSFKDKNTVVASDSRNTESDIKINSNSENVTLTTISNPNIEEQKITTDKKSATSIKNDDSVLDIKDGPTDIVNRSCISSKQDIENVKNNPDFQNYLELKQDSVIDENPELSHDEVVQYLYKTWLYEENNKCDRKKTDEVDQTSLVKGVISNGGKDKKRKKLSRKRHSDSIDTKKKQPTIINHFFKNNGFQEQFEKSLMTKTELQVMKSTSKTDFQQSNSPESSKDTVSDYRNNESDVKKSEEERNTIKSNDLSTLIESEDKKNQNLNESTDYEPEEYDDKKSVNEDTTNDDGNFDSSSSSSTESETEMTISKRRQLIKRKRTQKENKKALMEPEFVRYLELKQDSVIDEHPELSYEEVIQYLYKTWLYEENNKSEKNITDEIDQTSLVKGASSIYADKDKKRKRLSRKRTSNASEAKNKPPTIINKFLMQNGYHDYHKKSSKSNDNEVSSINTESRHHNVNETEFKMDNDDKSQIKEILSNDKLDNPPSDSSESECEISLSERKQMWKEKRTQAEKKKTLMDAEFVRYLELRQDYVMDEHPELTEEEITNYLYKTWLYEEKIKNEKKRDDDIDQTSLVKGVDFEPKKPKRKFKIVKEDSQESFKVSEVIDVEPKEKSKRSKARPYYNEEISDIEEELALFEIFRKKPNKPNVEQQANSSQPSQEVDLTHEEEIANIEDYVYNEMDMVEMYFEQLTTPKPNVFKGLARERVCEICEKVSNLVKCKTCHGMFHADCVKNQHKTQTEEKTPSRGRKKKKKYQRRIKNSDETFVDDDHSDDKTQDGHSDPNLSIEADKEPIVADAEDFEAKASAKMREILGDLDNVPYDYESTKVAISWNTPGKCQIVDVKLEIKRPEEVIDSSNFKCKDCEKLEMPKCFVCKSPVSPKQCVEYRQKCQVAHCHKYYHEECLAHWPQTQFNGGDVRNKSKEGFEAMSCPRHVCHTCVSDDPRGCKTRFSGDKLARCVRCPATYHTFTKCLPAGSQILTGSQIICPRHYEHRPGKVPCHVNTGWCFICALGGTLICCEYCPTSFHAECLNIDPPEGGYMCEDCETGRLPLYGEMVWVKLGHYRWWPGIILHPSQIPANIMAVKHSQGEFVVRFFGQYDHYWVNRGRVFPFQEGDTGKISSQKSKIDSAFTLAIEHASRACEILKNVIPDDEETQDIASSLLPPHYVKLKVNKPVGSLVNRRIDVEESSLTQCECDPTELEPCGPYSQCLNRMLLTECGPTCRAGECCNNRAFEKRQYPKMAPYRTPHRGWGLRCLEDIKAGQFVIEYVGELLDEAEFQRRMRRKHEVRDENFYFLTLDKERMIDAGPKGNLARFMNHSCEPNCETQKWTVLGDVRVGLFAIDDIPANSELTFNYNLESAGIEKKQCMCGAKRCSGYIGAKPKQSDPQPKKNKIKDVQKKPKKSESQQKRPRGRPRKPKELTEIEKDLLIIKNATISDDSVKDTPEKELTKNSVPENVTKSCSVSEKDVSKNCSVSSDSEYSERCSVDSKDGKAVKRKRSSQESLMLCLKRVKVGEDEFRID
ncbi:protein PF14_0175-like [Aricia agestis]|uniref:protein PF14_0175-like n=1 Tax=Aricia agestis TaxID=91739 RepID=UPI001C201AA3|nr:protein PF14_0175-like [Aricia agestis]